MVDVCEECRRSGLYERYLFKASTNTTTSNNSTNISTNSSISSSGGSNDVTGRLKREDAGPSGAVQPECAAQWNNSNNDRRRRQMTPPFSLSVSSNLSRLWLSSRLSSRHTVQTNKNMIGCDASLKWFDHLLRAGKKTILDRYHRFLQYVVLCSVSSVLFCFFCFVFVLLPGKESGCDCAE